MVQAKLRKSFPPLALFRVTLNHLLVPEGVVFFKIRWRKAEAIARVGVAATSLLRQIILHKKLDSKRFYLIFSLYLLHICNFFVRNMKGVSGIMVMGERESYHFQRQGSHLKQSKW